MNDKQKYRMRVVVSEYQGGLRRYLTLMGMNPGQFPTQKVVISAKEVPTTKEEVEEEVGEEKTGM